MNAGQQLLPTGRFGNILLATECSEFSQSAEDLAAALAVQFQGRVTAMTMVVSNPEYESVAFGLLQEKESAAMQQLVQVKERIMLQGVPCDVQVRRGVYPHDEIIDAAVEIGADLVVMGRRGRRGLARLMVGDATARVVAKSPCKVLVVPRGQTLWHKTIFLATDGSRYSDRAAVTATILAKKANIPLRVVSVVETKSNTNRHAIAKDALDRVFNHAREEGVEVTGNVIEGHPVVDVLAEAAAACQADLVVGGSHGRTGMERVFLGSVMERLIGRVSCPVLAIKGG
ncbi:MAG: universal stress protein [Magnetococcales bacterium]|nr:universal stress protein [Magnetococcales bacterium]MBF0630122.1 universal stress protein [Magnetococcales bacterium]